jgi:hypothetical protein
VASSGGCFRIILIDVSTPHFQFTASRPVFFHEFPESQFLREALVGLFPVSYEMINNSQKNNCQLNSTFDECFKRKLGESGLQPCDVPLPTDIEKNYQHDFAFKFGSDSVVFEPKKQTTKSSCTIC